MGHDEKTCLRGAANNTGADQPVHPRSLISAFVIRSLKSTICKLATGESLIFYLVSVAEQTGLKLALLETPKTEFVVSRPMSFQHFFTYHYIVIKIFNNSFYTLCVCQHQRRCQDFIEFQWRIQRGLGVLARTPL